MLPEHVIDSNLKFGMQMIKDQYMLANHNPPMQEVRLGKDYAVLFKSASTFLFKIT